jgi:hypothetical protein
MDINANRRLELAVVLSVAANGAQVVWLVEPKRHGSSRSFALVGSIAFDAAIKGITQCQSIVPRGRTGKANAQGEGPHRNVHANGEINKPKP